MGKFHHFCKISKALATYLPCETKVLTTKSSISVCSRKFLAPDCNKYRSLGADMDSMSSQWGEIIRHKAHLYRVKFSPGSTQWPQSWYPLYSGTWFYTSDEQLEALLPGTAQESSVPEADTAAYLRKGKGIMSVYTRHMAGSINHNNTSDFTTCRNFALGNSYNRPRALPISAYVTSPNQYSCSQWKSLQHYTQYKLFVIQATDQIKRNVMHKCSYLQVEGKNNLIGSCYNRRQVNLFLLHGEIQTCYWN